MKIREYTRFTWVYVYYADRCMVGHNAWNTYEMDCNLADAALVVRSLWSVACSAGQPIRYPNQNIGAEKKL